MATSVVFRITLLLMWNIYFSVGDIAERSDGKGCTFKFFQSIKSYTDALSACKSYGGTLGIPDTAVKMTFLHGMLVDTGKTASHLIGGKKRNDGKYYWEGNTQVSANGYNGYKDSGEPQNVNMYIRYVDADKQSFWKTASNSAHYLCQKKDTSVCLKFCSSHGTCVRGSHNLYNCHSITTTCKCNNSYYGSSCQYEHIKFSSCSIPSESKAVAYPLNISCDVTGPPFPITTGWTINGANAVNNSADAVLFNTLKTPTSLTAKLTLKQAVCLGETKIRLAVSNRFGSWNKDIIVNSNFVAISNVSAISSKCGGSLTLLQWASEVPIYLKNAVKYNINRKGTAPTTTNTTTYTVSNLTPETSYEATIEVLATCKDDLSVQQAKIISFKTGIGPPNNPSNITTQYKGSFICEVAWISNNSNITSIKLFVDGKTNKLGKSRTNFQYNENVTIDSPKHNGSWIKSLPPNKIYKFQLSLSNCAGDGPSVLVNQNCTTPTTVPEMISNVTFQSNFITNGTFNATVPVISEENGPIRCVLVCITTETNPGSNTSLTHAEVTELTSGKGYVAYCLKNVSIPRFITLGNEEKTACIHGNQTTMFNGKNDLLDSDKTYRVFLITITESQNETLYRGNEAVVIISHNNGGVSKPANVVAPVVVSLLVVVLLAIAFAAFIWRRRKQQMKLNQTQPSTNDVINNTSYENFETDVQPASEDKHTYECVR